MPYAAARLSCLSDLNLEIHQTREDRSRFNFCAGFLQARRRYRVYSQTAVATSRENGPFQILWTGNLSWHLLSNNLREQRFSARPGGKTRPRCSRDSVHPQAPESWEQITVKELINHTSGLPDSLGTDIQESQVNYARPRCALGFRCLTLLGSNRPAFCFNQAPRRGLLHSSSLGY